MAYLRGAVAKLGQALANWPTLAPDAFADVLSTLQFDAPPMHYALLRETLRGELGGDRPKSSRSSTCAPSRPPRWARCTARG